MQFIIGVDGEGVACVAGSPNASLTASPAYAFACRQATREADAAARALLDAGAERVIVWDNHGGGGNLDYERLDERCEIALGTNWAHRWPELDSDFAGVLMIGYHAMDSTPDAVLAHTFDSTRNQEVRVNGRAVGEIAIDAAMAGLHGVPVLLVAGDDKAAAEASDFLPGVETVTTKRAHGFNAAVSLHPNAAAGAIALGVRNALARLEEMRPFTFDEPCEVEIRSKRIEFAESAARQPGWERVDAWTVRRTCQSLADIW